MGKIIKNGIDYGGNIGVKKQTITQTTSANGNINTGLLRTKCVLLGAFPTSRSDTMCIPAKWSGDTWGLSVLSVLGETKKYVANTSVTVEMYYIEF